MKEYCVLPCYRTQQKKTLPRYTLHWKLKSCRCAYFCWFNYFLIKAPWFLRGAVPSVFWRHGRSHVKKKEPHWNQDLISHSVNGYHGPDKSPASSASELLRVSRSLGDVQGGMRTGQECFHSLPQHTSPLWKSKIQVHLTCVSQSTSAWRPHHTMILLVSLLSLQRSHVLKTLSNQVLGHPTS